MEIAVTLRRMLLIYKSIDPVIFEVKYRFVLWECREVVQSKPLDTTWTTQISWTETAAMLYSCRLYLIQLGVPCCQQEYNNEIRSLSFNVKNSQRPFGQIKFIFLRHFLWCFCSHPLRWFQNWTMDDLSIQWVYHKSLATWRAVAIWANINIWATKTRKYRFLFFTNDGFKPIYVKTQKTRGSDQVTEVSKTT